MAGDGKIRFALDRGGTFTDVFAEIPASLGGGCRVLKLLSEDPSNYPDAPREGIRRVLEAVTGEPHPRDKPLDTSRIEYIRMGTTVATNALLERKGERSALVITKGFQDLLHIGNQSRPEIFDLRIATPDVLYDTVVEVDERVVLAQSGCEELDAHTGAALPAVEGITGEGVVVRRPPDEATVTEQLRAVRDMGIQSVAVVFMHSYTYPEHERMVGRIARDLGFTQVSLSSDVMPMVKIVSRGFTATADAYLTPHIVRYLQGFEQGFDSNFRKVQVQFMQSDGGLTDMDGFSGHKAILSGPAGGVVGYARTTYDQCDRMPVVGFDMGGTSTDVSRYDGSFEQVFETTTAGVTIQAPQLDIDTVAAGGGSRLFFRNGLFMVGPDSCGADPGPVCYRKGGPLGITDANLQLGRLQPQFFPSIFGPKEDEPLDAEATAAAFRDLAAEVNAFYAASGAPPKDVDDIAFGFLQVANEAMCRPIRALTQMKGFDITTHVLACFGGAGGQHACAIARSLGMSRIFIHRYSGILSAYGLGLANVVQEGQSPFAAALCDASYAAVATRLSELAADVHARLVSQGFADEDVTAELLLNLRYDGTDTALMTPVPGVTTTDVDTVTPLLPATLAAFRDRYRREFGFELTDRDVIVDDVRVRGVGTSTKLSSVAVPKATAPPTPVATASMFFDGRRQDTPVYRSADCTWGHTLPGPAMLIDDTSTVLVEPGWVAHITEFGDVDMTDDAAAADDGEEAAGAGAGASGGGAAPPPPRRRKVLSTELDPIQLSIFSHRFMSIAEQMGRTLQRTSISVNIKERLDFSCALFGPDGSLVANAPHIPVHLGAMQEAVKFQIERHGDSLKEGDVLVSNHPQLAGGSHLPDITVMTPVFVDGAIVFWVANRGHHADIGGIAPGSMPPHSSSLAEEGAAIVSFKLVEGGMFQEDGITELLMQPGTTGIPGCSGTRNLRDNISDLKAQVAANTRGISLVQALVGESSLEVVHAYMKHIQANAEVAVREMLVAFSEAEGLPEVGTVEAEDFLDDGSPIRLLVTIDRRSRTATFDFTGTGPEVLGNCNAPPAVTYSAVIYCLRCMVGTDIPLNQGCLNPITFVIPKGTLLNPSDTAAVVGGNVLTSQRVVDVILKAFRASADSQGCMNNLTFGNDTMGYYETIAGGAGAGPTWHGRSGVHTHMTNTRITDPEILERRYPVVLRQFSLRPGSGGVGAHCGGDGVVRELEFRVPLTVSILSERRAFQPHGLLGGGPGKRGLNLLVRRDGSTVSIGGKSSLAVKPHDRLRLLSPGGGAYGAPDADAPRTTADEPPRRHYPRASGSVAAYKATQESV